MRISMDDATVGELRKLLAGHDNAIPLSKVINVYSAPDNDPDFFPSTMIIEALQEDA